MRNAQSDILSFLVIGAGGVGGVFGGLLARAGRAVTMYARGAHLEALRERGAIEVRTPEGTFAAPVRATGDAATLPDADVALLAVKSYSLAEVLPVVRRAVERGACVLPFLNGVSTTDVLEAGGVPRAQLLGGIAFVSAARVAPGVVERRSPFQRVVAGELDGRRSERVESIVAAFRDAGADARASERIDVELWEKLVFIAAMAAACGLARRPIGPVRATPLGRRLIARAVDETVAVARARGVALEADTGARVRAQIDGLPADTKPSFLLDLERGGPTELDVLSGAIARFATEAGLDAPVHETAAAALGVQ